MFQRVSSARFHTHILMIACIVSAGVLLYGCSKGTPGASTAGQAAETLAVSQQPPAVRDTSTYGWVGVYSFEEVWETEGQDIKNIITYALDVAKQGDSLQAEFSADGYMTSIHIHCATVPADGRLVVLFREAGEDNMFSQAGEGDTLFTLVRKGDSLLTYWGAMQPQATPLEDGTPYFKKDRIP